MAIKRAIYPLPNIGMCRIDYRGEVVVGLQLTPHCDSVSGCERTPFSDDLFLQIEAYLAGEGRGFDVEIDISALPPFQQKVLRALQDIPYGELRSYKQIAEVAGNPKAARAVGSCCNRNPIHLIIPCHRVVGSNGSLVGYAAGVEVKRYLLHLEKERKRV